MPSLLCFLCHSTVSSETSEAIRHIYKEIVGISIRPDSHLCHICCHVLNKLWLFRAICLKRSLGHPVLYNEKGTLNLRRNQLVTISLSSEGFEHSNNFNHKVYNFYYGDDSVCSEESDRYVKLEEDNFEDNSSQADNDNIQDTQEITHTEIDCEEMVEEEPKIKEEYINNTESIEMELKTEESIADDEFDNYNDSNDEECQQRTDKETNPLEFRGSDLLDHDDRVPDYSSGSEDDQEESPPKRYRGRAKIWSFYYKFPNSKEAEDFLSSEKTWSRNFTSTTKDGKKAFYRCNKVRSKGPQCAAEIFLLYESDTDNVFVYRTESPHTHNEIGIRANYGINEQTKLEINKLFDLHLKPKSLLAALKNIEGIKLPTNRQLNNYLTERRKIFGLQRKRRTNAEMKEMQLAGPSRELNHDELSDNCPNESESQGEERKRGRKAKLWSFYYKFPNLKEAEDFLRIENTWSKNYSSMSQDGKKVFYRCNKVRRRGLQCAAEIYLLHERGTENVYLYNSDNQHNHDEILQDDRGINQQTKLEINKLLDLHLKPKSLLEALRKIDGIKLPTKTQLRSYLNARRRIIKNSGNLSEGDKPPID